MNRLILLITICKHFILPRSYIFGCNLIDFVIFKIRQNFLLNNIFFCFAKCFPLIVAFALGNKFQQRRKRAYPNLPNFVVGKYAPTPAPLVWYQILAYTLACVRLSSLCIESSHTKFRYLCFCKPALYLSPFCSVNSFIKILSADASCNCDISFCTQLIIELFYNLICIKISIHPILLQPHRL